MPSAPGPGHVTEPCFDEATSIYLHTMSAPLRAGSAHAPRPELARSQQAVAGGLAAPVLAIHRDEPCGYLAARVRLIAQAATDSALLLQARERRKPRRDVRHEGVIVVAGRG